MKLTRTFLWLAIIVFAPATLAGNPTKAEQELLAVEDAWVAAWINFDSAALEKLYATEYLSTGANGHAVTRDEDIASTRNHEWVVKAMKLEDMSAHVYGNVGVVTGENNVTASSKGEDVSGAYRFTDVFVKRDGRWQCVATQATRVTKQP